MIIKQTSDDHTRQCCVNCGCQHDVDFLCTVVQGQKIQENRCGSVQCKVS